MTNNIIAISSDAAKFIMLRKSFPLHFASPAINSKTISKTAWGKPLKANVIPDLMYHDTKKMTKMNVIAVFYASNHVAAL